ncbi:hypothetical protein KOW79_016605 [Hemibagrus wyckioides]|uniref:Uncharacterized protein n=1 Tax=Hemibagrus wyckioides TaxID=337641 RepID=A0A9D3SCV7_9TELE|nr:hypothetical protein KOW79_016605 [Hemibagrus wyckioides]
MSGRFLSAYDVTQSPSTKGLKAVLGFGRLIPVLLDDTVSKNVKSAWGSELRCTSRRSLWGGVRVGGCWEDGEGWIENDLFAVLIAVKEVDGEKSRHSASRSAKVHLSKSWESLMSSSRTEMAQVLNQTVL